MEFWENLSNHLRRYQMEHNLSIEDLANELRIGRSAAYQYLRGKGNPSLRTLVHMADRMEMTVVELLSPPETEKAQREAVLEYLLRLKRMVEDVE